MFSSLTQHYDALVSAIIRPPREAYTIADLGPRRGHVAGLPFERFDVELANPRGLKLACSHFIPFGKVNRSFPCVIYMHGNSSCRMEALSSLALLLSLPATVFCFDFSGSGISEGDFVSLGYWEKEDLATVVDYLRAQKTVDCIGLWGRSMGAVTALLHADRDPSLAGLVVDSPFTNLRLLAKELVESGRYVNAYISSWLVDVVLSFMKGTIEEKANFDIDQLVPIEHVGQTFVPALFAAGDKDTFIYPHHAKELFDAYSGEDKLWYTIKGNDHNTVRPDCFLQEVASFFWRALQCDQREPINPPRLIAGLEDLPANIRRIRSRSRPGEYTYEDVRTGQRYASLLQAQRVAARISESEGSDDGAAADGAAGGNAQRQARQKAHGRRQTNQARKIANEFMIFRTWTTEDLVNLGFSRDKSEEASKRCKSLSLESAVAWLCDSDNEEEIAH